MSSYQGSILLSTSYFPPVQYFTHFINNRDITIECHENYLKQTYRNRCRILSPQGMQELTVPVERGSFHKVRISDLKIDYSGSWQKNHLRSLKTSYNSSAFYEFYIDEFSMCIENNHKFLLDLNMEILQICISILDLDNTIRRSNSYVSENKQTDDFRYTIHPKIRDIRFLTGSPEYFQVFATKSGFIPNLSILDLIFNMGPESFTYLKSYKQ
jgi:hypothetical protein